MTVLGVPWRARAQGIIWLYMLQHAAMMPVHLGGPWPHGELCDTGSFGLVVAAGQPGILESVVRIRRAAGKLRARPFSVIC